MKNNLNPKKTFIQTPSIRERLYQHREDELVESGIRQKMNNKLFRLFTGNPDRNQIRRIVQKRRKKEIKKIETLLSDLEQNTFIIERRAHSLANKISHILKQKFPQYTIELVLIGSNATGSAMLRKNLVELNSDLNTDFDCAVLIEGFQDPNVMRVTPVDKYFQQKELLNQIHDVIKQILKSHGVELCEFANPIHLYAPTLQSVDDAFNMLLKYFNTYDGTEGLLYFYPTYPPEKWQKNIRLIKQALKKLRRNRQLFNHILEKIHFALYVETEFKESHISSYQETSGFDPKYVEIQTTANALTNMVVTSRKKSFPEKTSHIIR